MSRSFITSVSVCLLLLGAGGVALWKMTSDVPKAVSTGPSDDITQAPRPSPPSSRQQSPALRWRSLVDDGAERTVRLDLARKIDRDLSAEDIDFLFKTLRRIPEGHAKESWWVVMNEIMAQMCAKGVAADRLGGELTSLVGDSSQPEVVRDYAVQYLSAWIAPSSANLPGETSPEIRAKALDAIARTITDPAIGHTSIPGTAIMSLVVASDRLPAEVTEPVWERLNPALTSMLKGETEVPLSTRTTVIQALALRGNTVHLPLIRTLSRDETIDPSMRLSSVAALGIYGSPEDLDYLTTLARGSSRYRYAAQEALKRIPSQ